MASQVKEDVYVIPRGICLLSRKASETLGIVKFMVGNISIENVASKFPSLFQGLGKMNIEQPVPVFSI